MLSNLYRLWCLLKEVYQLRRKWRRQWLYPKVELVLLHVSNAAILNWRAVACGMRSGTTTGLTGRRGQRCSRTAWQTDSGIRLLCHLVHPIFCSTWTATGKKIPPLIYTCLRNNLYLHTGIKLEKEIFFFFSAINTSFKKHAKLP